MGVYIQEETNGYRPEQITRGGECEERKLGDGDNLYHMCLDVHRRIDDAAMVLSILYVARGSTRRTRMVEPTLKYISVNYIITQQPPKNSISTDVIIRHREHHIVFAFAEESLAECDRCPCIIEL
jgi:hypothetical protein